jgi:hypothetical protein
MVGAVVRVARFVARYELLEVVEESFFVLCEERGRVFGRRDLVLVLQELRGES